MIKRYKYLLLSLFFVLGITNHSKAGRPVFVDGVSPLVTQYFALTYSQTLAPAIALANLTQKKGWEAAIAAAKKQAKKELENFINNQLKEMLWSSFACLIKNVRKDIGTNLHLNIKTPCGDVNFNFPLRVGVKIDIRKLARNIYDQMYDSALSGLGMLQDKSPYESCLEGINEQNKEFCKEYLQGSPDLANFLKSLYLASLSHKKEDNTNNKNNNKDVLMVYEEDVAYKPEKELLKRSKKHVETMGEKYSAVLKAGIEYSSASTSFDKLKGLIGNGDIEATLENLDSKLEAEGFMASDSIFKFKNIGKGVLDKMGKEEAARAYAVMSKQYVRDTFIRVLLERNEGYREQVLVFMKKVSLSCSDMLDAAGVAMDALMDGGQSLDVDSLKKVECAKVALQGLNTLAILENNMTNIFVLKTLYSMMTASEYKDFYLKYIEQIKEHSIKESRLK